jgi:ABC-type multidrug transport system fused ATPase/permease subunit
LDLPIEEQEGMLYEFPLRPLGMKVHHAAGSSVGQPGSAASIDWEIHAGESVALAGQAGSQIFDWAYGLRSPASGHLSIEGIDPRDVRPDFLRHRVALVRDNEVFGGSLAENVHLGRSHVTSHAVREALEQVGLLDSISQLPDGLETELGSDGRPLTDAQVRRLMLARAIVARPGLLLVDGILDALSDQEGTELMSRLCDSRQPWTLVIKTGRGALQRQCQRIIETSATGALLDDASTGDRKLSGESK